MHDIRAIRENPDGFDQALMRRDKSFAGTAAGLVALDDERRRIIGELQTLQETRNARSREIGKAKAAKDEARAQELMAEVSALKERAPALEADQRRVEREIHDALAALPNLPADETPDGADEAENVERSHYGTPREGEAAQHFELGEAMGLMDFETAAKLSGSRFVVTKGQIARLERALGQFMIDLHTGEHGYTEVNPPLLVRDEAMFGTGQLPKFAEDLFEVIREWRQFQMELGPKILQNNERKRAMDILEKFNSSLNARMQDAKSKGLNVSWVGPIFQDLTDAFGQYKDEFGEFRDAFDQLIPREKELSQQRLKGSYLIPTAEVPLTNLVRESILAEEELPLRFTALTPCFRAEAGSAGRDTRGMLRQHQFWKCELVSITAPETSRDEHERMLACAEAVMQKLDIPYRVMTLCTGDMGFAAQKTYDIEAWLPGQQAYREISSCSVCGDFQARRMGARFRRDGKPHFVHTLNGSGVAVGRALIAVMENYQNADGSVTVPSALAPYMGGITRIERQP
ncbi:MAG: seryl-tRNA synthetase SerS [Saliniramus fredricksonii]|uniref:Serine--tRNA ligase n=1 Tax=Saliniramus fredricksonii TaxID=1653334 RepID=A0A0P7X7W3_9HYPH|nr:serine--tRNA ligase [Saliniramus fredricksonii]KPQ11279.1 MAG: seryl-tRNA synthetase SerS [Saliniramus fredricksonii]SCC81810.1 seryl-tRNA synthetase [Saliniramus fredricksonii]